MADQFNIYEDKAGKWRWRYIADDGNIMADSGQGYDNKDDCEHGIDKMKASQDVPVVET